MNYLQTVQLMPSEKDLKEVECRSILHFVVPIVLSVVMTRWRRRVHAMAYRFDAQLKSYNSSIHLPPEASIRLASNTYERSKFIWLGKHLVRNAFASKMPASVCMKHNCACLHFYLLVFVGWMWMQSLSGRCTGELLITNWNSFSIHFIRTLESDFLKCITFVF